MVVFILLTIVFGIIIVGLIFFLILLEKLRYNSDGNPYRRVCKKCGATQVQYESVNGTWWGEVYPIGNDPNCICHKDAEYRDW